MAATRPYRPPTYAPSGWSSPVPRPSVSAPGMPSNNAGMGTDTWNASGLGLGGMGGHLSGGSSQSWQGGFDNRIGTANYGAFNAIGNWLSSAPAGQRDQRANYLNQMGIMPTYNGAPISGAPARPTAELLGTFTGGANSVRSTNRLQSMGQEFGADHSDPGPSGVAAPSTGGPFASLGGTFRAGGSALGGMKGGDLDGSLDAAYRQIIQNGGSPHSAADRTRLEQEAADRTARGTGDAVEAARLSAARRGTTLGPEAEARIRQRGVAGVDRARFDARTGMDAQRMQALLAALGGAGGLVRDRRQADILAGQLAAQAASGGMSGLNLMLGLG